MVINMEEQDRSLQQLEQHAFYKEAEKLRIGMCIRVVLYLAVIAGASFAMHRYLDRSIGKYWPIVPLGGIITAKWFFKHPWEDYREAYKKGCVYGALESLFTDLYYDPYDGISDRTISETGMMYMGDRVHTEDYIRASFNGIPFEQSDLRIEEKQVRSDAGRRRRNRIYGSPRYSSYYARIFSGRWMIFPLDKPFRTSVQILQKGFRNTIPRRNAEQHSSDTVFERTGMELESFQKDFRVLVRNSHNSHSIVTPALMEQVQNLSKHVKGKLMIGFLSDELHISIDDNGNSLEPPINIFLPIRGESAVKRLRSEMEAITQFFDWIRCNSQFYD